MFAKHVRIATLVAVAAAVSLFAGNTAQAATAKSYSYIAWIETQSVVYMVEQTYGEESFRADLANEANDAAQAAFLELLDVENNVRGSSLLVARDHIDEAAFKLYLLAGYPLPQYIRNKVNSAQRYLSYARNAIQKQLD